MSGRVPALALDSVSWDLAMTEAQLVSALAESESYRLLALTTLDHLHRATERLDAQQQTIDHLREELRRYVRSQVTEPVT